MKDGPNDSFDPTLADSRLRRIVALLRNAPSSSSAHSDTHLDDDVIETLLEGNGIESSKRHDAIAHLSDCPICRSRLAAVSQLLDDAEIVSEIDQLDQPPAKPGFGRRRLYRIVPAMIAAAAAVTIIVAAPGRIRGRNAAPANTASVSREGIVAASAAPRILSPVTVAAAGDSLRWTSVPQADLYRIRIWNADGTVVWAEDTRDTTLPLPPQLARSGGPYLWEIKARTGWDRWVTSDFLEFTIHSDTR
jgi:hypothetical protein